MEIHLFNNFPFLMKRSIEYACILQEAFRYIIYRILRETQNGLQEVSDNSRIMENKHILAYVSGLGFGIMSGAFSLVNILADSVRAIKNSNRKYRNQTNFCVQSH